MREFIVVTAWMIVVCGLGFGIRGYLRRIQVRHRLWTTASTDIKPEDFVNPLDQGILTRWLYLAGFRRQAASTLFVFATAVLILVGLLVVYFAYRSGILVAAARSAEAMPGGIGTLTRPILPIAPWILLGILTLLPTSMVRRARRKRVELVELDLPITLELLATLGESGIGVDAGIARILNTQRASRPLASELRMLQAELLAGRSRIECLRRLAQRLDVTAVTVFISAIVQAEQIGLGVASVLRQQADDLRQRRRERALEISMALPVKQLFPLVICFLPGILIFAIGPLFAELLRYTNAYSTLKSF